MREHSVEISPKTIAFTIFFLLGLYFIWLIKDLIFNLFIAFILMSALRPGVNWLKERNVPHTLAVVITYLAFLSFFIFLISLIIPPIIAQTVSMVNNLPSIVKSLSPSLGKFINIQSLVQYIPNVTSNAFTIIGNIFSNTLFIISTLFFAFYLLIEENILRNFICRFLEKKRGEEVTAVLDTVEKRMSAWFWGEITLMTVVGVMTLIGLTIIGVKYAVPLAVLAGLLEVVPNIGPVLSAVPAILIGMTQSVTTGGLTAILYVIVQQLENTLIVPMIMRRAVGLNPIATLISLVIGGRIGGMVGVLLAIPAYLALETILMAWLKEGHGKLSEKLR